MNKKLVSSAFALALATAPLSAFAGMGADENFNIYGWQNWSYEFIDVSDGGKEFDRLSNNAANIGFMAHLDTGMDGLQVGFRCEQFTYFGRNNQYTNWCNRNSKISLRHETMGEIMFAQWLLPYNEIVAQWVDPFYDAGLDSHTSIMGNLGNVDGTTQGFLSALFYNGSFDNASDFTSAYGALSFNRRQEGIVQYVWPNSGAMASQSRDGFQFRIAITEGSATDQTREGGTIDPRIWSTGVSWQQNLANGGQIWLAAAYENHEDLSITDLGASDTVGSVGADGVNNPDALYGLSQASTCDDSDDEGMRFAGRYSHDWGDGMKTMLAGMYEELDYEASGCEIRYYDLETGDPISPMYTDSDSERDAWMVSVKHMFGNGMDFRASYMDADDVDCSGCFTEEDTGAEAYNLGLFYTMPAGTELRLTYSEVDNDANAAYTYGINGVFVAHGQDVEAVSIGIVQWFD